VLAVAGRPVGRIGVVVAMTYSTVESVRRGGWCIALAALFILIGMGAILMGAITAGAIWMAVTGRAD
jgi:hypothetical protein